MATFMIHEDDDCRKENCGMPVRKQAATSTTNGGELKDGLRRTFGVLNNVQLGARAHAQKTSLASGKPLTASQLANTISTTIFDENVVHRHQLQLAAASLAEKYAQHTQQQQQQGAATNQPPDFSKGATAAAVAAVAQCRTFQVYEDPRGQQQPLQDVSVSSLLDEQQQPQHLQQLQKLQPAQRNPLQELLQQQQQPQQQLESPMSIADFSSPMSVDKSMSSTIGADDEAASAALEDARLERIRQQRERFFEVPEYQADILEYLREAETKHLPRAGYMRKQPDINQSMRTILVDWLVEVCEEYRLQRETLCLAVSYIDRFLSTMSVVRAKLQLVGTAAMFIAAKYEEIYPPDVNEFVYITDHTYTKKQVLRMEQLILKVLTFDLFVPTMTMFVNLYVTMTPQEERVKHLAAYICELSLLESEPYLQYMPSLIGAAAIALGRHICGLPVWSPQLQQNIGYSLQDMHVVLLQLARTAEAAATSSQTAIQEKYKGAKYLEVSTLLPQQPFDEDCFQNAVADLECQFAVLSDRGAAAVALETTGVREMISSMIFS